jgi:hypothetical protein
MLSAAIVHPHHNVAPRSRNPRPLKWRAGVQVAV